VTVTGTLIGGPTRFFAGAWSTTYRADISSMVSPGFNVLEVSGLDFLYSDGAGVLVIFDDGSGTSDIDINDGTDFAYANQVGSAELRVTEPVTFTFDPATDARVGNLILFALLGANDATARLLPALSGVALVPTGVTELRRTRRR